MARRRSGFAGDGTAVRKHVYEKGWGCLSDTTFTAVARTVPKGHRGHAGDERRQWRARLQGGLQLLVQRGEGKRGSVRRLTMRLTVALGCLGAQRVDGVGEGRSGGAPAIHTGRRLDPGDVVAPGLDVRAGKREKTSTVLVDRSRE